MISVYGSTGFIGSHFCDQFKSEVITIPRNNCKPLSSEVLYLISTTNNYNIFDDPYLDINTNLTKLISVIQQCKESDVVFNFVSSWFVYGDTDLPAKETSPCNPKGFYSITKKAAEDLLISYCSTFNIKYRIFRLCNVIGSNDKFSKKKNALQFLTDKVSRNEPISLYHGGKFIRDYMHVDDICRGIKYCMANGDTNEIYNIGSGEPYKFIDIIKHVMHITKSTSTIESIDPPPFHKIVQVKDMYLDISKLNKLGFEPELTLHKSLERII